MGLNTFAHPDATEAVKLRVKGLAVATDELPNGFLLLGRELDASGEHLFPLKADPPLHDLLLWHDHCKHAHIHWAWVCYVFPRQYRCIRQWLDAHNHVWECRENLNIQIYTEYWEGGLLSWRMPMAWHLRRRQAWHWRRFFLVILHLFRNGQWSCVVLFMARLKRVKTRASYSKHLPVARNQGKRTTSNQPQTAA